MQNNKRLIYADDLREKIAETDFDSFRDEQRIIDLLNEAETVDATEVVHAKWAPAVSFDSESFILRCSACNCGGFYWPGSKEFKLAFCPTCGAKMDGGVSNGL